jgi:uncharacterized FlaG/YvyC family protein
MSVEAVNSVLQAAPVIRGNAEQNSTAESSGNPERVQKVAEAPYVSPYFTVDVQTNTFVTQIRDSSTGKVIEQIPSQRNIQTRAQAEETPQPAPQAQPEPQQAPQTIAVTPPPAPQQNNAPTAQQLAAFTAAAQSGNTNAGAVSLFA